MKSIVNYFLKLYSASRYKRIEAYMASPIVPQERILKEIVSLAKNTEYGKKFGFRSIKNYEQFRTLLPITEYDDIRLDIFRMLEGESDVLWPGKIKWFAKSSGTTSDKSKYIPISNYYLKNCHIKGGWDAVSLVYKNMPNAQLFNGKSLILGGSLEVFSGRPSIIAGDISAILIKNLPQIGRWFFVPDIEVAIMQDWETKIEITARKALEIKDMAMFGGVPTWNLVLFKKMLELSGKNNLLEIWPGLQLYIHGGVGFGPYKEQFKKLIPSSDFKYQEIYNASEGFFAIKDDLDRDDMLLLLDNGIFYEFIPLEEYGNDDVEACLISEVKIGIPYVIVISNYSGLWRHVPGDTITFTSLYPHRIQVFGRTQQFVNAFGEELMISNAEQAIAKICEHTNSVVSEYTVAPIYIGQEGKGSHQWLVEFDKDPNDLEEFSTLLDKTLQSLNSDYEAKRSKNIALENLKLTKVPKGTFYQWMKSRGKLGGQFKIPRLSNNRVYIDEILHFLHLNKNR